MKLIYYYDISSSSSSTSRSSRNSGNSDNSDSTSVVQPTTCGTPHNMYSNFVNKYAYDLKPGDNVLVLIPTIGGYNGPLFEMRFRKNQAYLIDTKAYNLCMWIKNLSHDTTLHIGPKTPLLTVMHQLEIDYMMSYITCDEMWKAINFFYPSTEPSTLPPPPPPPPPPPAASSLPPEQLVIPVSSDEEEEPGAAAAAAAAVAVLTTQAAKIRKELERNFSNWGYNYEFDEEYYECMDDDYDDRYQTKEY
jgi:hypothetical protein